MDLYRSLSDLSVVVDGTDRSIRERETTSEFMRTTTVIRLDGTGETGTGETGRGESGHAKSGYGEDVTYESDHHYSWLDGPSLPLAGEYTIDSFSRHLDDIDLFPGDGPDREVYRQYRRWALESAALDLGLKQAGETFADALGREYDPVRFLVSTRLGDPPTVDRIERLLAANPDLSFKLDPTADWSDDLVSRLVDTGAVLTLDLKGHYEDTGVDQAADRELYETVLEEFPNALVEDPALTEETRPLFDGRENRVSWDAPITSVEDIESLPWEPCWLNIKPSRFGSLEAVLDAIEYCRENDIRMYGGGQFELDVGRRHLQALASVFYPDAPNDVAPAGYNLPDLPSDLPASPLRPPRNPVGLEWDSPDVPERES